MAEPVENIHDGAMDMVITVDDGLVRVPIKNRMGDEIGVFYFRPTDIGIIDRYNRLLGKIDEITEPLENVTISADGTAEGFADSEEGKARHEAERRLYEAIDELFGGNAAEAFFGKMHPFSPVNGAFYCENAIEALGGFIEKQYAVETEKMTKRVAKYTKGYQKK